MTFNKFFRRATRLESIFDFWIGCMLNVEYFKLLSVACDMNFMKSVHSPRLPELAYVCNVGLEKVLNLKFYRMSWIEQIIIIIIVDQCWHSVRL